MADVTLRYKNNVIAELSDSGNKILQTGGKYCEDDIALSYTKPSGGGGASKGDVTFFDYDGSIVASYSAADFANLAALPANPTHTGLTAQGWNWTLADAKAYVADCGKLNIGQMYITSDGKTRIYIHLEEGRLSPTLGFGINGTATVEWGDGTSSTVTGSSASTVVNTQHTYPAAGDYVIAISGDNPIIELSGSQTTTGSLVLHGNKSGAAQNAVYYNAIQRVEIGRNVRLELYAFARCHSLASVTIPDGVTIIEDHAFSDCHSLASVTIPDGVAIIEDHAFYNCYSLASVTIPDGVTSIAVNVFHNCYSLASVTIPDGVTSILNYVFSNCHSLASVIIPDGVTDIAGSAFYNCYSLASVTIPDGVTIIEVSAFYNCYSLASVTIPDGVTIIDVSAFYDCHSLASVTIPDGVTSIGSSAFYNCYSLASVTIPDGVTSIGSSAFSNCKCLGELHFKSTAPPSVASANAFSGIPTDCIIYVPAGTLAAYTSATNYPSSSTYTYMEE